MKPENLLFNSRNNHPFLCFHPAESANFCIFTAEKRRLNGKETKVNSLAVGGVACRSA